MIGKKVLEVGCNEENILQSNIADVIMEAEYLGVDMLNINHKLPVIEADILQFAIEDRYDTILMIEVLEHVHLRDWELLISKLKRALVNGGYLIVSVPAKQKLSQYLQHWNTDYYQIHTVFGIDRKALEYFFPEADIKFIRYIIFNQDNKSFFWALGRFVKRFLSKKYYWILRTHYLIVSSK